MVVGGLQKLVASTTNCVNLRKSLSPRPGGGVPVTECVNLRKIPKKTLRSLTRHKAAGSGGAAAWLMITARCSSNYSAARSPPRSLHTNKVRLKNSKLLPVRDIAVRRIGVLLVVHANSRNLLGHQI